MGSTIPRAISALRMRPAVRSETARPWARSSGPSLALPDIGKSWRRRSSARTVADGQRVARLSRLASWTSHRQRTRRPVHNALLAKSIDERWLRRAGTTRRRRSPSDGRRRGTAAHRQVIRLVQAIGLLAIDHSPGAAVRAAADSRAAGAAGKLAQACPQLGIVASPRSISGDRAGEIDRAAGPPLAARVGLDQVLNARRRAAGVTSILPAGPWAPRYPDAPPPAAASARAARHRLA
jgi:hypothetical protein